MAWIIGDVHGCIKTLEALLKRLPSNEKIIFVGDLVDRGVNSKEVIKLIRSENYDCIMGNHEYVMSQELENILNDNSLAKKSHWVLNYGGLETLRSYNHSSKEEVISDINWLKKLTFYKEYKDLVNDEGRYLVVSHSSIGNFWQMKDNEKNSFEYNNFNKNITTNRVFNPIDIPQIYNIFGHTPYENPIIKNHFANIDTGACYERFGYLTAIEFPSLQTISQKNVD